MGSKIDSTEESALQEINWYLEVNKIGFTKTRTENWCLRVIKIGPIEESAPQKLNWYLEVNKIDFIKMRPKTKIWCLWVSKTDLTNEGTHQKGKQTKVRRRA